MGSRFVSFATHGLIQGELSGLRESALVLTPESASDTFNDGLFTASEIADLSLSADLVTLSACNTAAYDSAFFQSEVQGLTDAFSIAGVPAVLVTLWPVESETSRKVMTRLYAHLADNISPAIALATAQHNFISSADNTAFYHPRFWAPFVLYGDGGYLSDKPLDDNHLVEVAISNEEGAAMALALTRDNELLLALTTKSDGPIWPFSLATYSISDKKILSTLQKNTTNGVHKIFSLENKTITLGYRRENQNSAFLRVNNEKGDFVFKHAFDNFPKNTYIYDAKLTQNEILFIAFSDGDSVWLATVDLVSRQEKTVLISTTPNWVSRVRLIVEDEKTILFISRSYSIVEDEERDWFHNLLICGVKHGVEIVSVEKNSGLPNTVGYWRNYEVNDVLKMNGEYYFAADRFSRCDARQYGGVYKSSNEFLLEPILSEYSGGSTIHRLATTNGGNNLVAIGTVPRLMDIRDPEQGFDLYSFSNVVLSNDRLNSGIYLRFDSENVLVERQVISSGADVYLDHIVEQDNLFYIFGQNANRPTLWVLE
jgi:hypothetical protein